MQILQASDVTAVIKRYRDAYCVARTVIGAGNLVKVLAILVGLGFGVGALLLAQYMGMGA